MLVLFCIENTRINWGDIESVSKRQMINEIIQEIVL